MMRRGALSASAAVVAAAAAATARPTAGITDTTTATAPALHGAHRTLFLHPAVSLPGAGLATRAIPRAAAPLRRQRWVALTHTRGPRASYFTDGKRSYARGTAEEQRASLEAAKKAGKDFLNSPVDPDGANVKDGRHVEDLLPSKKQLNDELPSAAELERALREGKMDAYTLPREKDEE